MGWLEATVTTSARHRRDVESTMTELGALAVTLTDAGDAPLLEPPAGSTPVWPEMRVTGLFPERTDRDRLRALIRRRLPAGAIRRYRQRRLGERDWERAWLEDFGPLSFGDRLCICPTGQQPPGEFAALVRLDPGLAFGTGSHPTTALCLEALAELDLEGCRVLDYGCGSGILAVSALKLGAAEAWAVDNDPQALTAARANAERNRVAERLHLADSAESLPHRANLVVANILTRVLCALAPSLGRLAQPGAPLLLSGILADQVPEVRRAYEPRFTHWRTVERDNWVLLRGRRR